MSSSDYQLIKREDLPDAPKGDYLDRLLLALNNATQATQQIQSATASLAQLTNSTFVMQKMTHGVELRIKNPLGTALPSGVLAVASDGLPVSGSVAWRRINSETQPDQLGITVNYEQPTGEDISLALTSIANIPNSVGTSISWSGVATNPTTPSKFGSALAWDGAAGIVVKSPGLYRLTSQILFVNNAVGFRLVTLNTTAGFVELARIECGANTAVSNTCVIVSADVVSNGAETFYVNVQQNSGGVGGSLGVFGVGSLTNRLGFAGRSWFQASRLRNDTAYSANVTFLITG